ncbi:MAG: hypothetical protein PHQ66_03525 [Candidatus Nanoarchaeia archaeon]|nr:hypothetical protein [Candidatus Nanoarchaeia archaeon]MDD5357567.1 hypothetical protein [Candidatus Nanoarchaeia archaeon]MDD5588486.1 hypothetical protein [Candidatus Nanoarchaeia archaeon]
MKPLQTLALLGILGLSGCKFPEPSYGVYGGYPFRLQHYLGGGKELTLYLNQKSAQCNCSDNSSYIQFSDQDNDGRFDSIILNKIPKDDSIERFASLDAGQKILAPLLDKKE